jgi:hypothetical protein
MLMAATLKDAAVFERVADGTCPALAIESTPVPGTFGLGHPVLTRRRISPEMLLPVTTISFDREHAATVRSLVAVAMTTQRSH